MTTTTHVRVTEASTREDIVEAMVYGNDRATASPPTVESAEHPTLWDRGTTLERDADGLADPARYDRSSR